MQDEAEDILVSLGARPAVLLERGQHEAEEDVERAGAKDGRLVGEVGGEETGVVDRCVALLVLEVGLSEFLDDIDGPGHGADEVRCASC